MLTIPICSIKQQGDKQQWLQDIWGHLSLPYQHDSHNKNWCSNVSAQHWKVRDTNWCLCSSIHQGYILPTTQLWTDSNCRHVWKNSQLLPHTHTEIIFRNGSMLKKCLGVPLRGCYGRTRTPTTGSSLPLTCAVLTASTLQQLKCFHPFTTLIREHLPATASMGSTSSTHGHTLWHEENWPKTNKPNNKNNCFFPTSPALHWRSLHWWCHTWGWSPWLLGSRL